MFYRTKGKVPYKRNAGRYEWKYKSHRPREMRRFQFSKKRFTRKKRY